MKTFIPILPKRREALVISTILEPHLETMVFHAKLRKFSQENFVVDYEHPAMAYTKKHETLKAAVEYHLSLIRIFVCPEEVPQEE